MPPFRDDDDKRFYIYDHELLFKALGIELTEEKIQEIIDDHSKDEQYELAQKNVVERAEKRESGYNELIEEPVPTVAESGLERVSRSLYNTADTPEARAWNGNLKAMVQDNEKGVKNIANMSTKTLLDFDDDLLTRSAEEVEEYVNNHPDEVHLYSVFGDLEKKFDQVYEQESINEEHSIDPAMSALVNAAEDKYAYVQGISSFGLKREYQAGRLSLILPELDVAQAQKVREALVALKNQKIGELKPAQKELEKAQKDRERHLKNPAYSVMSNLDDLMVRASEKAIELKQKAIRTADADIALIDGLIKYHRAVEEHNKAREVATKLSKDGVLGKEGIYTRAYREVPVEELDENNQPITRTEKQYISKRELVQEMVNGGGQDIKYEKVSAADRDRMNQFLRTTQKGGAAPMWNDAETRRKYADVAKILIESAGRTVSDEDYNKMLTDPSDDVTYNYANSLKEMFQNVDRKFRFDPNASVNPERLLNGILINGDSPEAKEWNENVSLLSQTEDGVKLLARIAAKRLLSIDMKALTEMDSARRIQYLVDHPIDRYMTFTAQNVTEAYAATLPEEERETDPVVQALRERMRLFEDIKDEVNIVNTKASRIGSFLPANLTFEEVRNVVINGTSALILMDKSDPVVAEAVNDFMASTQAYIGAKAAEQPNPAKEVLNRLVASNQLTNNSIYQKPYIIETRLNENGEPIETKHTGTLQQLAELSASDPEAFGTIQFEDRSPEETAKLREFMESTPNTVTLNVSPEERRKYVRLRELRTIHHENGQKMFRYVGTKHLDNDLDPELRSLYENARAAANTNHGSNAAAMAFKYVNEHHDYTKDPIENKKFEVALVTLAMIDGRSAKALVERINIERGYGSLLSKPQIDLDKILEESESGIQLGNDPEKLEYDFRNPFDKRVQNVKEIYDHLSNDLDPWYHKNGPEFKEMMQSMRNVLDYATISGGAATQAVEALLKDIEEKAANYAKTADANHSLGRNRRAVALAMVTTLNPKAGEELLGELRYQKTWVNDIAKKNVNGIHNVETRDFLNRVKLSQSLSKEEIVKRMEDDIEATKAEADAKRAELNSNANEAEAKIDEQVAKKEIADLTAQHMVKQYILKNVKSNDIDTNNIIMEISKNRVVEQGKQISRDNVYEQVVSNMKLNQDQKLDHVIDTIEKQYQQDRLDNAKAEKAAEEARIQAEKEAEAREKAAKEAEEARKRAEAERIEKNKVKYTSLHKGTKQSIEVQIKYSAEKLSREFAADGKMTARSLAEYIHNNMRLIRSSILGEKQQGPNNMAEYDKFKYPGQGPDFKAIMESDAFSWLKLDPVKADEATLKGMFDEFKETVMENEEDPFYSVLKEAEKVEKQQIKEQEVQASGRALH